LPKDKFLRIHKSYTDKSGKRLNFNGIYSGNKWTGYSLSRHKKEALIEAIGGNRITVF